MNYPTTYTPIRCKICDSNTHIIGVCDFNKTCEEEKNKQVFPLNGTPVYYNKCDECNHTFTTYFDNWTIDDFLNHVYNDDYKLADPDYTGKRAEFCFNWFSQLLNNDKSITILDYGAGLNQFSKLLVNAGYRSIGYDSMWSENEDLNGEKFDVITAFEVFEHTPRPFETLKEIISMLKPESGQIVFSTLINNYVPDIDSSHWYLSPRNGHVGMFSKESLEKLFNTFDMTVQSLSYSQHVASWKN